MAEASRLPWYSFLYRLLGAQGTFYLWLIAIITVWWTTKPAVVRMANRKPAPLLVAEARSPSGLVRWVQLKGLEIELDRGLLQREEKAESPPARLLLASDDPAAAWWLETRRLCAVAGGSDRSPEAMKARLKLIERRTQLAGDGRKQALPAPERSILLQDLSQTETRLPAPVQAKNGGAIADFEKALDAWIALVLERVRPDAVLEGVLDEAPQTVAERVKQELEVVPAPYLLQLDRRPRETESVVFGVAALILIFLGAGLFGASSEEAPAAEPKPEPAPESAPAEPSEA